MARQLAERLQPSRAASKALEVHDTSHHDAEAVKAELNPNCLANELRRKSMAK